MIVLDANILIRAILGRRVRQLIEDYAALGIRFFAPENAFDDAGEYLPDLVVRRGGTGADVAKSLAYLSHPVEPVISDTYGPFEEEARARLRGRDEEDWPVAAAALALGCPIWTEDADFFGSGIAVWTTSRVEIYLKERARERSAGEEQGGLE